MLRIRGQRLMKYVDQAIATTAGITFNTIQVFNKHNPNPSFTPKWSEKPPKNRGRRPSPSWDGPGRRTHSARIA